MAGSFRRAAVKSPKMRIVLDRPERVDSMDRRSACAWLVMTRYLALYLLPGLLLATSVTVRGHEAEFSSRVAAPIVKVGLVLEDSSASPAEATADEAKSCERVTITRSLS
jgi:hypothetical protein